MHTLNNSDIEQFSCELMASLNKNHVSSQNCTKIRLMAEDLLLKYQKKFGSETEFSVIFMKRLGKVCVTLQIRCESFDPLADLTDEDRWLRNVINSLGYTPTWKYKNNCNELYLLVRCENIIPIWAATLIACGLGAICGLVASQLLPEQTIHTLTETVMSPVSSAVMGFLGAVSAMLIFLSIIDGIVGMGNLATLNRIGKKMFRRFGLSMLVLAVLATVVFGLIFPISNGGGSGFDFASLWHIILDIVPSSFTDPFNSGNALQILFLSFVIGFIVLRSLSGLESVVSVLQGLYQIVQDMMALVLKALPLVVFISLFNLFSGTNNLDLRAIYRFPLLQLVLSIGWLAIVVVKICIRKKVRPSVLIRKLMPTFLIGFSTASSNATMTTSMDSCEKKLGISPGLVRVGVPLSYSIDKPTAMVMFMSGILCMAQLFSVEISWSMLITMILTASLLAVAVPAVPGSGVSAMTLLLTLYGIPLEALSIIISLDVITDRIVTATIVTNAQLDLIQVADSMGELDEEALRS